MPEPPLIDAVIAGAPKAGTTTLARVLDAHPSVQGHPAMEFAYFVDDRRYTQGYQRAVHHAFGPIQPGKLLLAKSVGIMYFDASRRRLADHNPSCRVIVLLRHPVERAWSEYLYLSRVGNAAAPSFAEVVEAELALGPWQPGDEPRPGHLARGDYLPQLRALDALMRTPVHVELFDDLRGDPSGVATRSAAALGLDPSDLPDDSWTQVHNPAATAASPALNARILRPGPLARRAARALGPHTREKIRSALVRVNERPSADPPTLDPTLRSRLLEHFAPRVEALADHLERDLSAWLR